MKKISILMLMAFYAFTVSAQQYMRVVKTDGSFIEYMTLNVDSVDFFEPTAEQLASFTNDEITSDWDGHDFVDLGLPTGILWATCNLGAEHPTDAGDYFAWGEVETKASYTEQNYKWYSFEDGKQYITKYNTQAEYAQDGVTDWDTWLNEEDNAVHSYLRGSWNIPDTYYWNELRANCTWELVAKGTKDAHYKVTGPNGNSILLPLAGYYDGAVLKGIGTEGGYWTGQLYYNNPLCAQTLELNAEQSYMGDERSRYVGLPIRPVHTNIMRYTLAVSANEAEGEVTGSGTYIKTVAATIKAISKDGYVFSAWSDGNTENPRVVRVDKNINLTAYFVKADEKGHERVDLGLSSGTLWATCNVGAKVPEQAGDYYAWGETTTKDSYSYDNYTFALDTFRLPLAYDAAAVNWGGDWRMPTYAEICELQDECTWYWTVLNGVKGYKVVGKNGKHIFLPAASYKDGANVQEAYEGHYWMVDDRGYYLGFSNIQYSLQSGNGEVGRSVRAVCSNKRDYDYTITCNFNKSIGNVTGAGTYTYNTSVTLTAIPKEGYHFTKWNDGNCDNPRIITVTGDKQLTAYFEKVAYQDGHAYVDLGLPSGLLWATCNVGATKTEETGDYFSWGETATKETYSRNTYTVDKYNTTDNLTTLEAVDDAASVHWGATWRMPTEEEMSELVSHCTWRRATINGVSGYMAIGPNNNAIFLPCTGWYMGAVLRNPEQVHCWSATMRNGGSAYSLNAYPDTYSPDYDEIKVTTDVCHGGVPVRPVTVKK